MTWAEVAGRLAAARSYWVGSTTGSGAPHAAPVWGAVTGGTLYLYTERSTVKARNLAATRGSSSTWRAPRTSPSCATSSRTSGRPPRSAPGVAAGGLRRLAAPLDGFIVIGPA